MQKLGKLTLILCSSSWLGWPLTSHSFETSRTLHCCYHFKNIIEYPFKIKDFCKQYCFSWVTKCFYDLFIGPKPYLYNYSDQRQVGPKTTRTNIYDNSDYSFKDKSDQYSTQHGPAWNTTRSSLKHKSYYFNNTLSQKQLQLIGYIHMNTAQTWSNLYCLLIMLKYLFNCCFKNKLSKFHDSWFMTDCYLSF